MYRVINKKVSHETEDKMQEKVDKLQKVPAPSELPVSSCLQNDFLGDPLRNSEFGIRHS